ncbi:AraC family transcriptional regulator [Cohnella zeiphila]|uniref:Helix-turn-helix transcriptional regulator n=1 Tax=Cohnella zeiphila TaxID=2761120 RepID=A0A7X0SHS5_9BACL|nr:AraC family transcriptional regulator [Cohnella zeiphila]MBB6730231.1 helix-turn-helix transcriptional regulator [Cohnella zeiphila]
MTISYFTILKNHLEHMQIEMVAAAESAADEAEPLTEGPEVCECTRMLLVTSGEGTLAVDGEEEPLKAGDCCIILSGMPHTVEAGPGSRLVFKWCHFHASFGDRELYKWLRLPRIVHMVQDEAAGLMDKIIYYVSHEGLTSRLRIKAAMLNLFSLYLERVPFGIEASYPEKPSQELEKIDTVLRYIDGHLAENITVEDLARQIFLHPNYFIVFFKGMMGCSPIQYVKQRRMETARALLLRPDCSISDVACRIGMKIYYFSRMFKSHTGLTPSKYRKLASVTAGSAPRS